MTMRRAVEVRSARRGVTLTEILIAIMILGIGLVSIATLFPIGLLRIHEAQRFSRTAFLAQSAAADMASRGLLSKTRFLDAGICPWYSEFYYGTALYPYGYDPWIQDTPAPKADWLGYGDLTLAGAYRGPGGRGSKYPNQLVYPDLKTGAPVVTNMPAVPGPGLPVVYDPLWWYRQGIVPNPLTGVENRFGSGVPLGLTDGSGGDSAGIASVGGLQRLTNLPLRTPNLLTNTNPNTFVPSTYNANMILSTFVSPEDVLWQETEGVYQDYQDPTAPVGPLATPSPVIPDLVTAVAAIGKTQLTNDWRYTCMFVGQQTDSYNGRVFDGDVVVFENRPFGFETLNNVVLNTSTTHVAGERVVQAVFGYGTNLIPVGTMPIDNTVVGVPLGSNNAILLLWPSGAPDPEIKTGSWVADVTYERRQAVGQSRFRYLPLTTSSPPPPPAQRCFWYQVQRVTPPADTANTPYQAFGNSRYALVYTSTNLRAKTLWDVQNGVPYHVNAALVSPYVVGVAPRTIILP